MNTKEKIGNPKYLRILPAALMVLAVAVAGCTGMQSEKSNQKEDVYREDVINGTFLLNKSDTTGDIVNLTFQVQPIVNLSDVLIKITTPEGVKVVSDYTKKQIEFIQKGKVRNINLKLKIYGKDNNPIQAYVEGAPPLPEGSNRTSKLTHSYYVDLDKIGDKPQHVEEIPEQNG